MESADALAQTLYGQGRTGAWLARETGYSTNYVYDVLGGRKPLTPTFRDAVLAVLGQAGAVPTTHRGRAIRVPENIYRLAGDPMAAIAVADAYEEAWKRSWIAEHGDTAVALAADRAWRNAQVLAS